MSMSLATRGVLCDQASQGLATRGVICAPLAVVVVLKLSATLIEDAPITAKIEDC